MNYNAWYYQQQPKKPLHRLLSQRTHQILLTGHLDEFGSLLHTGQ
jgi:hypothetical protein